MISLMGPGKATAKPDQITDGFLAMEFHDIAEPRDGLSPPTKAHVEQILNFLADWDRQSDLLVHCWMGISRSTATAAIALAQMQPEADMQQLAARLRTASPMATPNPLMISIADDLMQLNGRLRDAIAVIGRGAEAPQGQPFALDVHP
jgi:predicted protein tyrosine phosphatase